MISLDRNSLLHTELWTSWASVLRSYGAAHGLYAPVQAVVEVSAKEIVVRVGARWVRFTPEIVEWSEGLSETFALAEDGTVRLGAAAPEEMDFGAERVMREMLLG